MLLKHHLLLLRLITVHLEFSVATLEESQLSRWVAIVVAQQSRGNGEIFYSKTTNEHKDLRLTP